MAVYFVIRGTDEKGNPVPVRSHRYEGLHAARAHMRAHAEMVKDNAFVREVTHVSENHLEWTNELGDKYTATIEEV